MPVGGHDHLRPVTISRSRTIAPIRCSIAVGDPPGIDLVLAVGYPPLNELKLFGLELH